MAACLAGSARMENTTPAEAAMTKVALTLSSGIRHPFGSCPAPVVTLAGRSNHRDASTGSGSVQHQHLMTLLEDDDVINIGSTRPLIEEWLDHPHPVVLRSVPAEDSLAGVVDCLAQGPPVSPRTDCHDPDLAQSLTLRHLVEVLVSGAQRRWLPPQASLYFAGKFAPDVHTTVDPTAVQGQQPATRTEHSGGLGEGFPRIDQVVHHPDGVDGVEDAIDERESSGIGQADPARQPG